MCSTLRIRIWKSYLCTNVQISDVRASLYTSIQSGCRKILFVFHNLWAVGGVISISWWSVLVVLYCSSKKWELWNNISKPWLLLLTDADVVFSYVNWSYNKTEFSYHSKPKKFRKLDPVLLNRCKMYSRKISFHLYSEDFFWFWRLLFTKVRFGEICNESQEKLAYFLLSNIYQYVTKQREH